MEKNTRIEAFGKALADVIIDSAHLTCNAPRGRKIVEVCIERLRERINELKSKKADSKYKKARYG